VDYTQSSLGFKIRKALRYVSLYGPRRTLAKVRAQYHMRRVYSPLPPRAPANSSHKHVGIIGCGNFAHSNVAYFLNKNFGPVIRAAMDINPNRAASLFEDYKLDYFTTDAAEIFDDPKIDLVYIASNHSTHATYGSAALRSGKAVHIEKPHVVSEGQLVELCQTMGDTGGSVGLGFNRPASRIGMKISDALSKETGSSMMNWFIAGHAIDPDHWYFKPEEGGRVLGNLCHWTDFLFQMVHEGNRFPIIITPTRADKSDCDIAVTFIFGDGSIGAISFSAKGHTFEGVRERFAAHRGNALIAMDDFRTLTVEIVEKKHRLALPFRDHGHENNILSSYALVRPVQLKPRRCSVKYVWETAMLFLKTKEALEQNRTIVVEAYDTR